MHDARAAVSSRVAGRLSGTGRSAGGVYQPWLHAYAVLVAVGILVLVCSGGLVTSHDAGLAVPDWPTSFGYNMFALPLSRWLAPGGVRLEHSHRLIASGEGWLTVILAVWLWRSEPRRWVRSLGYAAFGAVLFQGVLGGLRVVLRADWIGIVHGCFAQAFFALVAFIAFAESRWWLRLGEARNNGEAWQRTRGLRRHVAGIVLVIYAQMALGAAMRHAHAGLSIPDFPTAYGHWWPQVHGADIPALNQHRTEVLHVPPTSLAQIHLQMTHRMMAAIILLGVVAGAVSAWRKGDRLPGSIRRFAMAWPLLIAVQVTLGMYTIWTGKAADVATAHVAVGALSLVWGVLLYAALRRWSEPSRDLRAPQAVERPMEVHA